MTYWQHLKANWSVSWRCLYLLAFHFVHGILPWKWTEHEHWGF